MQSLVLLPVVTTSLVVGGSRETDVSPNLLAKINIEAERVGVLYQTRDSEALTKEARAQAVDAYFARYNMPLRGTGLTMVEEAEKNGLDWRLVAAIAVRESTGGKYACKKVANNPFGWGSCKIGFESNEHAIATIAWNLGGNNPNTARHYENKTTEQILRAYNPPHIVPRYANQVIAIMNAIGPESLGLAEAEISTTS